MADLEAYRNGDEEDYTWPSPLYRDVRTADQKVAAAIAAIHADVATIKVLVEQLVDVISAQPAPPALPDERPAVLITRRNGVINSSHVSVRYQKPHDAASALKIFEEGGNVAFVQPMVAGAVLDALGVVAHAKQDEMQHLVDDVVRLANQARTL